MEMFLILTTLTLADAMLTTGFVYFLLSYVLSLTRPGIKVKYP